MTLLEFWQQCNDIYPAFATVEVNVGYTGKVSYRAWNNKKQTWVEHDDPEKCLDDLRGFPQEVYDIVISEEVTFDPGQSEPEIIDVKLREPWEIQQDVFDQINDYFPDTPMAEQIDGGGEID